MRLDSRLAKLEEELIPDRTVVYQIRYVTSSAEREELEAKRVAWKPGDEIRYILLDWRDNNAELDAQIHRYQQENYE